MKNDSRQPDFPGSQRIYRRLLLAYPRLHRAKYGAAMAQLFRDQCRDAWSESRNWGLLKLWLRILPELVSTSILEQLAARNERKSMNDRLANLFSFRTPPATAFFRVFVVMFLLVFISSVVITFVLPEIYASTVRVMVNPAAPPASRQSGQSVHYEPYSLQAEFNVIQSKQVLNRVIDALDLTSKWGNKYNGNKPLTREETMQLLIQRMSIRPDRSNFKMFCFTVYDEDRSEAAQLANAISESYRDYRAKFEGEKLQTSIPQPPMVTIVDSAYTEKRPVKPNRPLNIALGTVIGILSGTAIGAVAAFIQKRILKSAI